MNPPRSTLRRFLFAFLAAAAAFSTAWIPGRQSRGQDVLKDLQSKAIASQDQKTPRAYHFGSQGANDVFSNHRGHTNRLIPIYTFGAKIQLDQVVGANSPYRNPNRLQELFGTLPKNTLDPDAEYADQSDLYRVQKDAIAHGVKHLFIVWFDGMDWETTRAAAIVRSRTIYHEGKGSGLVFQDDLPGAKLQYGFYVTSPSHDHNIPDVNAQTVVIPPGSLPGGYDPRIAGVNPWTKGRLEAPGYLKGQSMNPHDKAILTKVGGIPHAVTDSSSSAGEFAAGVKMYNNGVNVDDQGRFQTPLFHQLQQSGWKVGIVTSVPFCHASPAAMYAHNVNRDDYQDLARDMLGLESITQSTHHEPIHPGLDVVMGTGFGKIGARAVLAIEQGQNVVPGNTYLSADDRAKIDAKNGGRYVVVEPTRGVKAAGALEAAAKEAAAQNKRLFGFFGADRFDHLPYRTADGNYDPVDGIRAKAEKYTREDLIEQPTLVDMTKAALTLLSADPAKPFALFIEAGDVDFALHDNNLDNAIGAVHSGEDAVKAVIDWIEKQSDWNESALIVTADHGHYLVIDDPSALLGSKSK